MLKLTLLGSPQIALGEKLLSDEINGKTLALLVYLAVTDQVHTRDVLADLLWSEMSTSLARKNLRNTLYDLRVLVGPHLLITRSDVIFDRKSAYWLDVGVFRRHMTPSQLQANPTIFQEVLNLYRGDFLAGFHVRNAPVFDEWMAGQRELLRSLALQGLGWLTTYALQAGDDEIGLAATNRLLALEPTAETTHRQRMWLLARSGQQRAALAQYTICQQVLAAELATTPSLETTELYEKIKAGAVSKPHSIATAWPIDQALLVSSTQGAWVFPTSAASDLPFDVAPASRGNWGIIPPVNQFYGRQGELSRLTQWLVGERCRLIGVFGIGGQGKTTLVARLVEQLRNRASTPLGESNLPYHVPQHTSATFFQRVIWRSLTDASPLNEIMSTWLQILTNQPVTALPTRFEQQVVLLMACLRTQRCLFVLDHVEQIMGGDARTDPYRSGYAAYGDLLRQFTTSAHQSCLLLISRERPLEFSALEEESVLVRTLFLEGLTLQESRTLLQARGVTNLDLVTTNLHQRYAGHPLALTLAAETIGELFHGDGTLFLPQAPLVFEQLRKSLDEQFVRLGSLEQEILAWLALEDRALPAMAVWDYLLQPQSYTLFLEALRALLRCSLIDNGKAGFVLPAVMREYIRQGLLETLQFELQATALPQVRLNAPRVDPVQAGTRFYTVAQRLRTKLGKAGLWECLQPRHASLDNRPLSALMPPHNLPRLLTSFVGRTVELVELQTRLLAFDYPLLTVVGEGGVGKTRLALALAERVLTHFPDGVWFVPLAGMTPATDLSDQLASAIGLAVQLRFVEYTDLTTQLFAYLRNKKVLLVLDSFDGMHSAVHFLLDLLQVIRSVKLLVTARQRLHVQSEFVFPLGRLAFPDDKATRLDVSSPTRLDGYGIEDKLVGSAFQERHAPQDAQLLHYASVQLFIERARQSAPDFSLSEANLTAISRICQRLEGMPLAIEWAASLVAERTCTDIAQTLKQNPLWLTSALRALPPRQYSPQAVMAYSWQLVTGADATR